MLRNLIGFLPSLGEDCIEIIETGVGLGCSFFSDIISYLIKGSSPSQFCFMFFSVSGCFVFASSERKVLFLETSSVLTNIKISYLKAIAEFQNCPWFLERFYFGGGAVLGFSGQHFKGLSFLFLNMFPDFIVMEKFLSNINSVFLTSASMPLLLPKHPHSLNAPVSCNNLIHIHIVCRNWIWNVESEIKGTSCDSV